MTYHIKPAITALLLCLMLGGSAHAQFNGPGLPPDSPVNLPLTPTTDMAILYPPAPDLNIGQGDLIAIHIFGAQDYLPSDVRVSVDGTIQLPFVGLVQMDGITVHAAENLIARRLIAAGIYKEPQVSIQIIEAPNHVVNVMGEVRTPSLVPVLGHRTLLEVLSVCGGLTPAASHYITIQRPGVAGPIVVNLSTDPAKSPRSDVPIFAGDTVIASRIGSVYVIGAFKVQGIFPLSPSSPTTLMQVMALAGGPNFEGNKNDTRIIRTIGNQRKEVKVDIKRIMYGKDPDPKLEADDIVFLPSGIIKSAIKSGGIPTLLGIASLAAYLSTNGL